MPLRRIRLTPIQTELLVKYRARVLEIEKELHTRRMVLYDLESLTLEAHGAPQGSSIDLKSGTIQLTSGENPHAT